MTAKHVDAKDEAPASAVRGVLVLGAGRHAAEVIDALVAGGVYVYGCLDAHVPAKTEIYTGVTVVGSDRDLSAMVADGFATVYLGIGGLDNLDVRIRFFQMLEGLEATAPPLVHPAAHVAPTVELGAGTTVLARASIGPLTRIGRNCIITQNAVITHHCRIGDHVVIAPNGTLGAGVIVGDEATIGMGTTIYPDLHIGRRAVIVNGVNLTRDVPDHGVVKLRAPVSLSDLRAAERTASFTP